MGGSSSKNKSSSNAGYQDNVWGGQTPYLQDVYKNAGSLFDRTNNQMQNAIPGAVNDMNTVADQSGDAWQNQMQGGAYQDMNLQKNLMNSLNQSSNNPSAMQDINAMIMGGEGNNYADAMKDSYMQDANRAQEMMLANTDARATASGMSGGSRHGIAQGLGMEGINDQLQDNLTKTGFDTFDKDLQRKLQIAGQADQNNFGRQNMMADMIANMQNTSNQGVAGSQNQQNLNMGQFAPINAPWDAAGKYGNIVGRPTILGSGSQGGNSSGSSKGVGK